MLAHTLQAGATLAADVRVADALAQLLSRYSYADEDELVLNCVCAVTNLSFYQLPNNQRCKIDALHIIFGNVLTAAQRTAAAGAIVGPRCVASTPDAVADV
eukprot:362942-Chlamydomonas_euryale.AAC.4